MPDRGRRPIILVVEDDPFTREQMADFLRDEAAAIVLAADGEEGLQTYHRHAPDIVVTDVLMPVMNGLDMAQRIRKLNPDAQMVILTACGELDDFSGDGCFPAHYLWKPVDIDELFRAVRYCWKRVCSSRRVPSAQLLP